MLVITRATYPLYHSVLIQKNLFKIFLAPMTEIKIRYFQEYYISTSVVVFLLIKENLYILVDVIVILGHLIYMLKIVIVNKSFTIFFHVLKN